jgi:hypothetical protein
MGNGLGGVGLEAQWGGLHELVGGVEIVYGEGEIFLFLHG